MCSVGAEGSSYTVVFVLVVSDTNNIRGKRGAVC